MAEREAKYRGVEIIIDTARQPDGTWMAVFILIEGTTRTPFRQPIEATTEDAAYESALDQAQREIDKKILYLGFAMDQEAELRSRKKSD
jgi:hypothetical protein